MKRIVMLIGGLLAISLSAQAGELYRWVDAQGKVHYGDSHPPDAALVEERRFLDAAPGAELSYETRRAQQNHPVTLYVAENCAEICNHARALLRERAIPFAEKRLKTREEIEAFKTLSGSDSSPTLAVGKKFLKGFLATQWHGELDTAGYPKIAPYRARLAVPPPAAASAVAPAATTAP